MSIKEFAEQFMTEVHPNAWGQCLKSERKYPGKYKEVLERTEFLEPTANVAERVYIIMNDIFSPILCNCGKVKKFDGYNNGYRGFCSMKCTRNNPGVLAKQKETVRERYGTDNVFQAKEIKEKSKSTIQSKYGVDNISQSQENKDKIKQISNDKYGVDHFFQAEEVKQKSKETIIERHGVDNISQSLKNQIEKKERFKENHGVEHHMQLQDMKDHFKNYWMDKIGRLSNLNLLEIQQKASSSIQETYLKKMEDKFVNLPSYISYIERNKETGKYIFYCDNCKTNVELYCQYVQYHTHDGYICPTCDPNPRNTSKFELEVFGFLESIYSDEIIQKDRTQIKPKELDIFLPAKNLAIECDGIYWHSELYVDKNYHLNKTNKCMDKGINLIHLFEDEWKHQKEIVKSRLKYMLGVSDKSIYARNCDIKILEANVKNSFLNEHHIQGEDKSSIKLGLFNQSELVSVMTFSTPNIAKGGTVTHQGIYELNRFCNKSGYNVPGSASKLFSYFKKNYEYDNIFTYADKRWSDGGLYRNLGMVQQKDTNPNYWYIINDIRVHRFNFRKSNLVKMEHYTIERSEREIMQLEGIPRIWDCGHHKFELK